MYQAFRFKCNIFKYSEAIYADPKLILKSIIKTMFLKIFHLKNKNFCKASFKAFLTYMENVESFTKTLLLFVQTAF